MIFFTALLIAIVITVLFTLVFKRTGPWSGVWVFFGIIFLSALAAGLWVPAGPVVWDIYWVPIVTVGLVVALIIAAATPARRIDNKPPRTTPEERAENTTEGIEAGEGTVIAFTIFFWFLLAALVAIVLIGLV